jgi:hypothetical protein
MALFRAAEPEVCKVLTTAQQAWHQWMSNGELGCPKLSFAVQMAFSGEENDAPALTVHGWPCAGKVKITSHHDRVAGLPDVVIDIDEDAWGMLDEQSQLALADSLLCRLALKVKDGSAVLDDCGRPKLKKNPPDAHIGDIYYGVIARHPADALEAKNISHLLQVTAPLVQGTFDWGT